ncbi:MAG: DUF4239 domain-containing protein [Cyanobacteria bacterium SZAS LIN-2]|nr:DUF4239 domain-containing protein [Cyanobacteria bacterium SZAS LIN-2]
MVTFFLGFVAMVVAICGAIFCMLLVRRKVDLNELSLNHAVADPLLSVIGTLFAVLLGFLVAGAMQRFDEARINVQEEAGALADVFRGAAGFPEPLRGELQTYCINYADTVINKEWKLMEERQASPEAWEMYGDIWRLCVAYNPSTEGQSNVHQAVLAAISRLGNYRTLRFAAMVNQLPLGMWIVVLAGGGATIAFTYFFEVKNERTQMLMTGLVATVMALNIFLLANYDYPFSGDVHVSSAAFELDLGLFKKYLVKSKAIQNAVPAAHPDAMLNSGGH